MLNSFYSKLNLSKPLQRLIFLLVMVLFFVKFSFYLFFKWDEISEKESIKLNINESKLSLESYSKIQEGDFILRRGHGMISDLIASHINKGNLDVTHVGILHKISDEWHVIHSMSSEVSHFDGVQIQPLHRFLFDSKPYKTTVTRLKNISILQAKEISNKALHYAEIKVPFDSYGDLDDGSKLFCTELVWRILEIDLCFVKPEISMELRKERYYQIASLYDKRFFDIVFSNQ
jgi:hypothetical protein